MTEFARNLSPAIGWICAGLMLTPLGVALLWSSAWWLGLAMALAGLPLLVLNARVLITRPPRLRIDDEGVWFGGGRTVPWREIKSVYLSTVRARRLDARALSFEFHDAARARRHLPIALRLRGVAAVGDLDLSANDFRDDVAGVAAQISLAQADRVDDHEMLGR